MVKFTRAHRRELKAYAERKPDDCYAEEMGPLVQLLLLDIEQPRARRRLRREQAAVLRRYSEDYIARGIQGVWWDFAVALRGGLEAHKQSRIAYRERGFQ